MAIALATRLEAAALIEQTNGVHVRILPCWRRWLSDTPRDLTEYDEGALYSVPNGGDGMSWAAIYGAAIDDTDGSPVYPGTVTVDGLISTSSEIFPDGAYLVDTLAGWGVRVTFRSSGYETLVVEGVNATKYTYTYVPVAMQPLPSPSTKTVGWQKTHFKARETGLLLWAKSAHAARKQNAVDSVLSHSIDETILMINRLPLMVEALRKAGLV